MIANILDTLMHGLFSCQVKKAFSRGETLEGAYVNIACVLPEVPGLHRRFVSDANTHDLDTQFLWGPAFLMSPVLAEVK